MQQADIVAALHRGEGLSLLHATRQHWTRPYYSYLYTPRPDHGILVVLQGSIVFECGKQALTATYGEAIYLPRGCHYRALFHQEAGAVNTLLLNFNWENAPILCTPTRIGSNLPPSYAEQFDRLLGELESPDAAPLRIIGLFHLLLDTVCESAVPRTTAQARLLQQAQALLRSKEELSIPEVARACCVSESGLRVLFREHLGLSPNAYRVQAKLNRAKYLLEATDMRIKEVADTLHFYDEAYFCKQFRKHTGLTPQSYIKQKRL